MPETKHERPRLIPILMVMLIVEAGIIVFLGVNLLTEQWTFLFPWGVFWPALQEAFLLVLNTPGEMLHDEVLFYDVVAFGVLSTAAIISVISGLIFHSGWRIAWILSLLVQIATLSTGIGLYLIHQPPQAYWLIVIGILMVLYLNYDNVRQWFTHSVNNNLEQGIND